MYHPKKYYTLLGIEPTKDQNIIKKAYRKKAMKYHPDKNPSKMAEDKFIAITNAYEVLTGQIKPSNEPFVKKPEDIKRENIRKAKRRYESIKEKEQRKDAAYYRKITSGWQWKAFQYASIYCFILFSLIWIDVSFPGKQKTLDTPYFSYSYSGGPTIDYEGVTFKLENYIYYEYVPPMRLNYTPIFKDLKSISIIEYPTYLPFQNRDESFDALKIFEEFPLKEIQGDFTLHSSFPYAPIILLIPIMVFYYKRPNFNFSLMRLVCIGIIFPYALIISLMDLRIFKLFYFF